MSSIMDLFMSGHSKWSQIKRKKGLKDQQRGLLFSKLSRLISIAVAESGIADPSNNIKLRMAISQAKNANMPKENITRAIEKGSGPDESTLQEHIYEGFGPEGTVFLVYVTTDNQNRTFTEIKHSFEKNNGKVGSKGSVSYLFKKCGIVVVNKSQEKEEFVFKFADEIGCFDIDEDNDHYFLYFPFENIGKAHELKILNTEVSPEMDFKPLSYVKITEPEVAKKVLNLVSHLENCEDVHKVFSNFDISEDIMHNLEV